MKIDYDSLDPTAEFNINMVGDITKNTYLGKFKVKCILSPLESIEADREYRNLLGNDSISTNDTIRFLALSLTQLKFRLIEYPPFWDNKILGGSHIKDNNIISEIFDKALEAQELYKNTKQKEYDELQKKLANNIKNGTISQPEIDNSNG